MTHDLISLLFSFWIGVKDILITNLQELGEGSRCKIICSFLPKKKKKRKCRGKGKENKEIHSNPILCVCSPYTFWWSRICNPYNSLLLFLSCFPRHVCMFDSIICLFYYVHFHYMMIRSPFRGKDRVWSRNKLVGWSRRCQYVIYSRSIFARPLHTCLIYRKSEQDKGK